MEINWYPGHMARAKRLLVDQLNRVDVVIELCDARLPLSSRNPDLKRLTARKERVRKESASFFLSNLFPISSTSVSPETEPSKTGTPLPRTGNTRWRPSQTPRR